jgi:predicted DsbA family dithiol-disulfide isomerase
MAGTSPTTPATRSAGAELPLVVFADFICPWSYATIGLVDQLAATYGFDPIWRPHLLHPEVPPEGAPVPDTARLDATKAWLQESAPDVAARMVFGDRVQASFRAFQVLELARDRGVEDAFRRAVFDALWTEGADIADPTTLARLGSGVGLASAAVAAVLRDGRYVERTLGAVQQARRLGITATPTLIIGTKRVNGWHYYEVLESIVEQQLAPDSEG